MYNEEYESEQQIGEPFSDIFKRDFLPYWPIVLFAGLLGLAGSFLKLRYSSPVYQSTARVIFKTQVDASQQILSQFGGFGMSQPVDKAKQNLELLRSEKVSIEAVKKLNINTHLYAIGRVTRQVMYKQKPRFECVFSNQDSIKAFSGKIIYSFQLNKYFAGGEELFFNRICTLGGNELFFKIEPADEKLLQKEPYELVIFSNEQLKNLYSSLQITEVKNRPLIEISLVTDDAQKIRGYG